MDPIRHKVLNFDKVEAYLYHLYNYIMPAAFSLLPSSLLTVEAQAMLIAIGLQESRFEARRQVPNGPANGFWQFEKNGGVKGVLSHNISGPMIRSVLAVLQYESDVTICYTAIQHNDVVACAFARCLLRTVKGRLPARGEYDYAWEQYIEGWQPGKPHRETWNACFDEAWRFVTQE